MIDVPSSHEIVVLAIRRAVAGRVCCRRKRQNACGNRSKQKSKNNGVPSLRSSAIH
jgi:hypothetical protein